MLLVLASMVAGARVMAANNDTVAVWAAARTLPVGAPLDGDALVVRHVRLSAGEDRYLSASAAPAAGSVVVRAVGEGELVPRSALGRAEDLDVRAVSIPLTGTAPDGLVAGADVDVWVTPKESGADGKASAALLLVKGARVSGVHADKSAFSSGGSSAQVLVPQDQLAKLLAAMANEDSITLTPVPGSAPTAEQP